MGISKSAILQTSAAVGTLVPRKFYRFLFSPSWSSMVYLVEFGFTTEQAKKKRDGDPGRRRRKQRKEETRAFLHFVPKLKFEESLQSGVISVVAPFEYVPPWLEGKTEEQLVDHAKQRRNPKKIHEDRIDQRLLIIYEASENIENLLRSEDPIAAINAQAKILKTPTAPARFRLWLFSYLLYGRIGLHYAISKIGKWDRKLKAETCPYAAHQVTGARAKKIVEAYIKHRGQGLTREKIYTTAMRKEFGCRAFRDQEGRRKLYHPAGDWYPTLRSFFYHVDIAISPEEIVKTRIGAKRYHTERAPDQGSYTEYVGNAYERVEYDPFYNKLHPRSTTGDALPKLTVGRMKDAATGVILGIGFDLSGETKQQLAATLFCAAIDKVKFASLFNVEIEPGDWPSIGLPTRLFLDRGAGAAAFKRHSNRAPFWPQITLPPKGVGQAKAIVETSHPKKLKNKEGPHYDLSKGTVWQMAMNEILRVKYDNEALDISPRIPAEWLASITRATPNALFQEFDRRGRNDAVQIPFETAVRTFLDLVEISADKDGVYLVNRRYQSEELRRSGFYSRLGRTGSMSLQAYHLRGCVNYIWLLLDGKLFELRLTQKVNNGLKSENPSYDELVIQAELRKAFSKGVRRHREGMRAEVDEESEATVGMTIDAGTTRDGRIKRTKESMAEACDTKDAMRGKL